MKTDTDDGWNELARELGLEQTTRPPQSAEKVDPQAEEPDDHDPQFALHAEAESEFDSESDSDETEDETEDGTAEDDSTPAGETNPDEPKKKRRRRRRRRRKGGEIGEAPTSEGLDSTDESEDSEDAASEEGEYEDDSTTVESETDGPSAEAARELVANWDVPSWEEIVAGLYRPGGR